MDNGHFITVLLGVIFGLWVLLLGVGGYFFKRINDRLDVPTFAGLFLCL